MEITSKLSEWHSDEIMIVEPNIKELPKSLTNCRLVDSHEAITKSDIIVLLVDHKEFFSIDFNNKYLIDTKGIKK